MTTCITARPLDSRSIYPVIDPHRTAGPGPYEYGYALAWDLIEIKVERSSALSSCRMGVNFASSLQEGKEIQAWNLFSNNFVERIGSPSLGLGTSMTLQRAGAPGQACGTGADTVVLCRYFAWPRGRTALYTFDPQDFWDFWGGCNVTFIWFDDTKGSGRWGDQTPPVTYPSVRFPDRTLMRDSTGNGFRVVFGGAGFAADRMYLDSVGFNVDDALAFAELPSTPADGVLVRELNKPRVYVVFGGAKFWIPDPATLFTLGYDWNQVRVIPPGGTGQLPALPIDATLLKEQHDPKVYLVENGRLRWVTSPAVLASRCLSWRNVRTVPDRALAALTKGPDL